MAVDDEDGMAWRMVLLTAALGDIDNMEWLESMGVTLNPRNTTVLKATPLIMAAAFNEPEMVEWLLRKGVFPNDANKDGFTPLHFAAGNGYKECVQVLIEGDADVNVSAAGSNGTTPLLEAVKNGHVETARMLLEKGAHISTIDLQHQYNAVQWAAVTGSSECLQVLLHYCKYYYHPSILNLKDSPFHLAVRHGHYDLVKFILASGEMQVNHTNSSGVTPLHEASMSSLYEIATLLLVNDAEVNIADAGHKTPLHYSAYNGDTDMCQLLLRYGAKLDVFVEREWCIPILISTMKDNLECFVLLLDLHSKLELPAEDDFGNKPVHAAAIYGALNIINYLHEKKHELDVNNKRGRTPLHLAARQGYFGITFFLLQTGVCINRSEVSIDGWTPLFEAVSTGQEKIVKLFLDFNVDVMIKGAGGKTIQHIAAETSNLTCLILIHARQELDYTIRDETRQGNTPLHLAVQSGHIPMANWLIKRGVSVNIINNEIKSPLFYALNHTEMTRTLLDLGAHFNAKDSTYKKTTPLHLAVKEGNAEVVKLLLSAGANAQATCNMNKEAPVHWAARYNHLECLIELTRREVFLFFQTKNEFGNQPIHIAAIAGNTSIVSWLVRKGVHVDAKNKIGMTPLYASASHGQVEVVELLLSMNADVNGRIASSDGNTVLIIAMKLRKMDVVALLLSRRANPNMATLDHHETPMHFAVKLDEFEVLQAMRDAGGDIKIYMKGHKGTSLLVTAVKYGAKKCVEWLIQNGIPAHFMDSNDNTPLDFAVTNGYLAIASFLIDHGAKINIQHPKNGMRTTLHFAIQNNQIEVLRLLLERGADVDTVTKLGQKAVHVAAENGTLECLKELVLHGCDVHEVTFSGFRDHAIHIAAFYGRDKVVKFLIDVMKTPVDIRNRIGTTALHQSCWGGSSEVTSVLLSEDATVNVQQHGVDDRTPLHCAARKGNVSCGIQLLRKGVNVNALTSEGDTPLHWAVEGRSDAFVSLLVDYGANADIRNKKNLLAEDRADILRLKRIARYLNKARHGLSWKEGED